MTAVRRGRGRRPQHKVGGSRSRGPRGRTGPRAAPGGYANLLARTADSTLPAAEPTALLEQASATASEQALDLYLCGYSASFVSTSDVTGFDTMTAPDQGGPFDLRYVGRTDPS